MNQIIEKEMKTTVTKIDKAFLSSEEQSNNCLIKNLNWSLF